ncbi:MAG: tetratricopeptide repeat protein [Elusimicrobia bacterium]|nr:tetratricopeptide repeat protein [Elusimicrobiota bacterium]
MHTLMLFLLAVSARPTLAQDACYSAGASCCYTSGGSRVCPQACVDARVKAANCMPPPSQHQPKGDTCESAMSECSKTNGDSAASQQCVQSLFSAAADGSPNGCIGRYAEEIYAKAELAANAGEDNSAQNQYTEAIRLLGMAEAANPAAFNLMLMRANSLFATGKLDPAYSEYTKALGAKDGETKAWAHEGRAHVQSLKGNHDQAKDEMNQAIAASPTPDMYGYRANVYERAGDARAAQADRARAGETGAYSGAASAGRGRAAGGPGSGPVRPQGELDASRLKPHAPTKFENSASPSSIGSKDTAACVTTAKVCDHLQQTGKIRNALKCSAAAVENFPHCLAAQFQNGWLWGSFAEQDRKSKGDQAAAEDWGKAEAAYSAALQIEPKDLLSLINGGLAAYKVGQFDSAIQRLSTGISLARKPAVVAAAHFNRGLVHAAKQEYKEALADYDAAYAVTKQATIERARACAALGRNEEARGEYEGVISQAKNPAAVARAKQELKDLK